MIQTLIGVAVGSTLGVLWVFASIQHRGGFWVDHEVPSDIAADQAYEDSLWRAER